MYESIGVGNLSDHFINTINSAQLPAFPVVHASRRRIMYLTYLQKSHIHPLPPHIKIQTVKKHKRVSQI